MEGEGVVKSSSSFFPDYLLKYTFYENKMTNELLKIVKGPTTTKKHLQPKIKNQLIYECFEELSTT